MRAFIHIGCDKAGSSSLQYFLGRNRDALHAQGVHLIEAGYQRAGGHPGLFRAYDPQLWAAAWREIEERRGSCDRVLFTWEGVHALSEADLRRVHDCLRGLDCRFIYYMREQAELIQSGLLQRLKADALTGCDLLDTTDHSRHLTPPGRRYGAVIDRFETVFGAGCMDVRVFERGRLRHGDLKGDFLDAIGAPMVDAAYPDGFQPYPNVNESLSVETGAAVQMLDHLALGAADRRGLRGAALAVARETDGSKYFLTRPQVEQIRRFYAEDNKAVALRFFGREALFEERPAWRDGLIDRGAIARSAAQILTIWPRYPWAYKWLPAPELLVAPQAGAAGADGVADSAWALAAGPGGASAARLVGARGPIKLLPSPRSRFPHQRSIRIGIDLGPGVERRLRVFCGDGVLAEISAPREPILVPFDRLGRYGVVDVMLAPIDGDAPLDILRLAVGHQ